MGTIDKNQDGRLTKDEVYVLMRRLNPWFKVFKSILLII